MSHKSFKCRDQYFHDHVIREPVPRYYKSKVTTYLISGFLVAPFSLKLVLYMFKNVLKVTKPKRNYTPVRKARLIIHWGPKLEPFLGHVSSLQKSESFFGFDTLLQDVKNCTSHTKCDLFFSTHTLSAVSIKLSDLISARSSHVRMGREPFIFPSPPPTPSHHNLHLALLPFLQYFHSFISQSPDLHFGNSKKKSCITFFVGASNGAYKIVPKDKY